MKRIFLLLFICFGIGKLYAQVFLLSTDVGGGISYIYSDSTMVYSGKNYYETIVTENYSALSGTRNWKFSSDTGIKTWRAPSSGIAINSYNTVIVPSSLTASAFFRINSGGSDGRMLATTSGSKYYFRIAGISGQNNYASQNMVILSIGSTPVSLTGASHTAGTNTITLGSAPVSGENIFVRYSTSPQFTSSSVAQVSVSGTTGTFAFSGLCGTLYYYFYSSSLFLANINAAVTTMGQNAHDFVSFNYLNNSGINYTTTISNPTVSISGNSSLCTFATTQLTGSGSNGTPPYTYTWSSSNTGVISSVTSPGIFTTITAASSSGSTNVNVTLTDKNGCTATNSQLETVYQSPTFGNIAGNFGNICLGSSLTLTASASGGTGPYTYSWLSPNTSAATLNTLTGVNTTIMGVGLGSSNIQVTITDAHSCGTTGLRLETVNPNPTVSIATTESSCTANDDKVLSGASVSFTATGSGGKGPYTYSWNNSLSSGATKTVSVSTTTTYTVTVTDANTCTATNSKTETVITAPNVNITGNSSVCVGSSSTLSASSTTGTFPYSYTWLSSTPTSATLNSASGTSNSVIGQVSGTTNINVTVTDNNGCTAINSKPITVNVRPVVTVSNKINDVCMTNNGSVSLVVTSGLAPYNITWTNVSAQSGTINSTGGSLTANSLSAGNTPFFITDSNGCTIISQ